jgi:hypothetical protein
MYIDYDTPVDPTKVRSSRVPCPSVQRLTHSLSPQFFRNRGIVRRYYVHILTTEMKMTVEKNVIDTELLLIMTMTHNNGDRTLL